MLQAHRLKKILFCAWVLSLHSLYAQEETTDRARIKPWTFIVYVAADNNLHPFAIRNIKQMSLVGSNANINIAVQLNIKISGNKKVTRRYYVEKDNILHVNANDPASQQVDSGTPQALMDCCDWAITNYPAQHYALVLWNHGSGILDPVKSRIINTTDLFFFNPYINKLELDRTTPFLELFEIEDTNDRGICWDDTTGNYINNQGLEFALQHICATAGKKLELVCFDACLMAMLEVANILKKYANVAVGSQEVEYGTGWDYSQALSIFNNSAPTPHAFATHIVNAYAQSYERITNDYTQSAINLTVLDHLEDNVNLVAQTLSECLRLQQNDSVRRAVRASRNKLVCTHFDEPSYIDLHHFYRNLSANTRYFEFSNNYRGQQLVAQLGRLLQDGCLLIESSVVANSVGKNLQNAKGISIYFPERKMHSSYRDCNFAKSNAWTSFVTQYLLV